MIRRIARRALSLFLLVLVVLSGIAGLLVPLEPSNLASPFHPVAQALWFGVLIFGGTLGIAGLVKGNVRGLYWERAGMVALTGLCFCVVLGAIAELYHPFDWYGIATVGIFGLCCGLRVWAIGDEAKDQAIVQLIRGKS